MGNPAVCFWRAKRSSAAAATQTPTTTSAAAESCPCEIRYSRSSSLGQWRFLKGTEVSSPLFPKILICRLVGSQVNGAIPVAPRVVYAIASWIAFIQKSGKGFRGPQNIVRRALDEARHAATLPPGRVTLIGHHNIGVAPHQNTERFFNRRGFFAR